MTFKELDAMVPDVATLEEIQQQLRADVWDFVNWLDDTIIPKPYRPTKTHANYGDSLRAETQAHIQSIKECMKQEIPILQEAGLDNVAKELQALIDSETSDYDFFEYERAGKFNWNCARPDLCLIKDRMMMEADAER